MMVEWTCDAVLFDLDGVLTTEVEHLTLPRMQPVASPQALAFLHHLFTVIPQPDWLSYMRGLAERNRIARAWCQSQARYPLVSGPVSAEQPPLPLATAALILGQVIAASDPPAGSGDRESQTAWISPFERVPFESTKLGLKFSLEGHCSIRRQVNLHQSSKALSHEGGGGVVHHRELHA